MKLIKELFCGKNNLFNGVIGLAVLCAIVMGCNCSKDFGNLANTSSNGNTTVTNTGTSSSPDRTSDDDPSDSPSGDVPSNREIDELVQETLLDFNDAVQKGDFTEFHDKIANVWKSTSTPQKLNEGFKEFIDKKVEISSIRGKEPTFDPQPTVTTKGKYKVLQVNGKYDTLPLPVRFENEYINEGGEWKLIGIRVDTRK